ncbi:hypothetical protein ACFYOT_14040 [Saccharothrix saharensis]|uniref:hypothetical protein n=1 Tax=Saccharothrix saharensis TaxID=571190 RepID=UPI0036C7AE4E
MAVVATDTPWALEVDALVVSVGGSFGELGAEPARRFPSFAREVRGLDLSRIPSSRPRTVEPGDLGPLRFVVLASPHGDDGEVSEEAVAVATKAAVHAAARAGAAGVALPLLATGVLGLAQEDVAAVVVPALVDALRSSARRGLRRVVLFARREPVVGIVTRQWSGGGPVAEAAFPATVHDDLAGGVSSDLVDPAKPIPLERDRLGVGTYVSMLATVIAERATPTPLSIGVSATGARARASSWACCAGGSRSWRVPVRRSTATGSCRSGSTPGTTPTPTCGRAWPT